MNETDRRAGGVRMLLWFSGLVLWGLAFLGLYVTWRAAQARHVEEANRSAAEADTVLETEGEPVASAWDPEGIEDFELVECSGRTVTKQDLLGRPWVVNFVFIRCQGPCLNLTNHMKRLQDRVQDLDVKLVTITVDPNYDTPERLANYGAAFGADPEQWLFLTGGRDEIFHLIQNSFKMPVQQLAEDDVLHSNNLLLVDENGVVQAKYNGTIDAEVQALVRRLRKEAPPREATAAASLIGPDEPDETGEGL